MAVPTAYIAVTAQAPRSGPPVCIIPAAILAVTARNPSYTWAVPANRMNRAQVIYRCTLTGAADGLSDVILPMSSFQATMRNGDPSYLAVYVPNSAAYSDLVTARRHGAIVIQKGFRFDDGTEQMEVFVRMNYESLRLDRGGRSDTMTVTGHRTCTATGPKTWAVSGASFLGVSSEGKRRIRTAPDLFLRVGDTCIFGTGINDSLIVAVITYVVQASPAYVTMEVSEE
jgi:hypothetical protein